MRNELLCETIVHVLNDEHLNQLMETASQPEVRNKPILAQEIAFIIVHLLPFGCLVHWCHPSDWLMYILHFTACSDHGWLPPLLCTQILQDLALVSLIIAFMAQTSARRARCGGLPITATIIATATHPKIRTHEDIMASGIHTSGGLWVPISKKPTTKSL